MTHTSRNPELAVELALPEQSAAALAHFIQRNPHYNGAGWADCLEVLYDSDASLEITEPIWEELVDQGFVTDDTGPYVGRVTLTLWWADNRRAPTADEVSAAVLTAMGAPDE